VIGDLLGLDRLEGAGADVKGDEGVGDLGEDGRGKVKAGGGGRDGAGMAREDGLVTVEIGRVGGTPEVRGDGKLADAVEIDRGGELDEAFPGGEYFFDDTGDAADGGGSPDWELASWFYHAKPAFASMGLEEEEFQPAIIGEGAGRDDFGVVEDGEIAGPEEGGKIGEETVLDQAGTAMKDHHARRGAVGKGVGGDEGLREGVVVIAQEEAQGEIMKYEL
jgi:hypothetical protein